MKAYLPKIQTFDLEAEQETVEFNIVIDTPESLIQKFEVLIQLESRLLDQADIYP